MFALGKLQLMIAGASEMCASAYDWPTYFGKVSFRSWKSFFAVTFGGFLGSLKVGFWLRWGDLVLCRGPGSLLFSSSILFLRCVAFHLLQGRLLDLPTFAKLEQIRFYRKNQNVFLLLQKHLFAMRVVRSRFCNAGWQRQESNPFEKGSARKILLFFVTKVILGLIYLCLHQLENL